ncbi:MAG: hypothetical protein ACP6IQ_03785 [Candidatus Njordarchaeia archaeon]|nr:hypothetical protein [Candidatus Korarchaeota archaeon]
MQISVLLTPNTFLLLITYTVLYVIFFAIWYLTKVSGADLLKALIAAVGFILTAIIAGEIFGVLASIITASVNSSLLGYITATWVVYFLTEFFYPGAHRYRQKLNLVFLVTLLSLFLWYIELYFLSML